jgi:inhibitor of cysteine peptidase
MRTLTILLLAAMTACAPATTPGPAPAAASQTVPAPTPEAVSIRIGADKNGQVVTVPVGQTFAIELVGVPTAGYVWAPAALPSFLEAAGDRSGPTIEAQNQPGYTGGNHWEVTLLRATGRGMGDVRMEQRRPWESNEAPASTFTVTIEAR